MRNKQIPDNVTVVEVDTTNEKTVYTKIKDLGLKPSAIFSLSDGFVEIACRVACNFWLCS